MINYAVKDDRAAGVQATRKDSNSPIPVYERGHGESLIVKNDTEEKGLYDGSGKYTIIPTEPTTVTIGNGIKVNLQPGQVLEKGLPEEEEESLTLTQTSKEEVSRGDKGKGYLTVAAALEPLIIDGTFFDVFENVSVPSLREAPKVLLGDSAGIGASKAGQVRDYLKDKGLPMSKAEWKDWSKQQNAR